uniref:Tyrosinase copper-binding domain-containing protein n=1 Tax=Meloidogyne javanica TaxID=6303 RepID=A0A915NAI0_MELJA
MEIALRLIDPTVALPYWDSVLDVYLPDPRDSIIFSPLFAGEIDMNGFVVNGPFAFWNTIEGRNTIWRTLSGEGGLFNEGQLSSVANEPNIEHVLSYTVPLAGCPIPHFWVGGDMRVPETSANDPIFYMHHSFVDLIFEIWRQRQQRKDVREWAYTSNLWSCGNEFHFSYAWMRPFDFLSNQDGLSNAYTDQLYRYAQRPTCSAQVPTCGSRQLRPMSRGIQRRGNQRRIPPPPPPIVRRILRRPIESQQTRRFLTRQMAATTHKLFINCFNMNPCCDYWAENGECKAACELCTPNFNTTNECIDRHVSCKQWKEGGECLGKSKFVVVF